ncbi:MAG TPA: hypothetical protein PLB62_01620 [Candidatus Sumerlaeota bacterium]|nr:hypothetical protein [Candidatus Sumerlaeota bacterium]
MPRSHFRLILAALILYSTLCLSPSCRKDRNIHLDLDKSVNVATPGKDFPAEKNLVASKKQTLELYGKPDFIHLWWSRDGRIHTLLEVDRTMAARRKDVPKSWIYLDRNIEIIFDNNQEMREIPLVDKLRTVCLYGDPDEVKLMPDRATGALKENWHYFGQGLILLFEDGSLKGQQRHTPMGNYIKR